MQQRKRIPQNRPMMKYAVRLALQGRVFVCFLACLLPAVLPWILQLAPIRYGVVYIHVADLVTYGISIPMTLLSFAATVFVTDPMSVKLASFFLTLNRDSENLPSPLSVCDCFGPGYGRLVLGMLQRSARTLLWAVLPIAISVLIPGVWETVSVSGVEAIRIGDTESLILLLAMILYLYRGIVYSMVPYLLADDPDISAMEAIRSSRVITRGRILELLALQLSFFSWIFLMTITFMIAGVYFYPYLEGTMAAYYIAFTQPDHLGEELHEA